MKGAYDIVKSFVNNNDFNIMEFLLTKSPVTPNNKVGMGPFQLDDTQDCIISNFMMQGINFTPYTYCKLVEFLNSDFDNTTHRVYLQVFVHFSKLNVPEAYKGYQANFQRSQTETTMMTTEEFFDRKIAEFLEGTLAAYEEGSTVEVLSETERQSLLSMLKTEPLLMAFESSIKENLKLSCDRKWLVEQISKLQVYISSNFKALPALRGACLMDGILICPNKLAPLGDKHKADFITLAAHECAHFLARVNVGDFNFSSPHNYLDDSEVARFDPVCQDLYLEVSREFKCFDLENCILCSSIN